MAARVELGRNPDSHKARNYTTLPSIWDVLLFFLLDACPEADREKGWVVVVGKSCRKCFLLYVFEFQEI